MLRYRAVPSALAIAALAAFTTPAHAGLVFAVSQFGNDVVVSASGSVDTTALTLLFGGGGASYGIDPGSGVVGVGMSTPYFAFGGFSGPAAFGSSPTFANHLTTSATGDLAVLTVFNNRLYLPQSYLSGTALAGTATYANRTLADVGLTLGTSATYNWGAGATADFVNVTVIAAVPEPSSLALLGAAAFAALGGIALAAKDFGAALTC